jgi:hypothetical protein
MKVINADKDIGRRKTTGISVSPLHYKKNYSLVRMYPLVFQMVTFTTFNAKQLRNRGNTSQRRIASSQLSTIFVLCQHLQYALGASCWD